MQNHEDISRRVFLERLAAGAVLGAVGASHRPAQAQSNSGSWTPPPVLKNPNILIIMVDQMRPPMWLNASQSAALSQSTLPNIMGRIQNYSYNCEQFFVAATACTASRAALLTGLYAPQTAMYLNTQPGTSNPSLNPAFPTWGEALPILNPAYQGNLWWFGKFHLTSQISASPLLPYGFKTRTYPSGYNVDATGVANEGTDGGPFNRYVWPSDSMIANDFVGWLRGQAPPTGQAPSAWCATVSLVNPHDICGAPAWFQPSLPPTTVASQPVYFPAPTGGPPGFYSAEPSPWNYENLQQVSNKPALQYSSLNYSNSVCGLVTSPADWINYLNLYFWLQYFVDQQVGVILDALGESAFADNTIIVFLSDHGELAGSHGLRLKGWSVYEESIRAPFYVHFPGQTGSISMNQLFSGVDFFGLICDLATGGSGQWRLAYPDLAGRQSIWSFLYNNCPETRVAPSPIGLPYILHTYDSSFSGGKEHIIGMRTKLDLNAGQFGAKLAFYSAWANCTTYPNSTMPDSEFYDYNPQTAGNTMEMGNDYYSTNPTTQETITQYVQVMGSLAPPFTGLIATELNRPLIGTGTDANPLRQAQTAAQQAYFAYTSGSCPE